MAESALSAWIVKYLNGLPGCVVRKRHGTAFAVAGDPDISGCVRGRHIEIEVKLTGRESRPEQVLRQKQWADAGAIVRVIHSRDEARALGEYLKETIE